MAKKRLSPWNGKGAEPVIGKFFEKVLDQYGHYVLYRRYNIGTKSQWYSDASGQGVGGPKWTYEDEVLKVRHDPMSIRGAVGTTIQKSKMYLPKTARPKRGDVIIELVYDDSDQKRTHSVDTNDKTGGTGLAKSLGDGHGTDFSGGEDGTDKDQGKRDDLHRAQADRGTRRTVFGRAYAWFCRALQHESRRSECEKECARQHAGFRKERDAQSHRKRRAGDIDQFVGDRFESEGGVEFGTVVKDLGPSRSHHGRDAGHGGCGEGGGKQRPQRPVTIGRGNKQEKCDHGDGCERRQYGALATPVHEPRDLRCNEGIGEGERGRDCAGKPIFAVGL